ncbi:hypothetical protein SYNPS1DRAFT_29885, partial [Syncephalis pseudoplumigaleata]
MYSHTHDAISSKQVMAYLWLMAIFLLCAGRGFPSYIDALPVPEAVGSILAGTDASIVKVAPPVSKAPPVASTNATNATNATSVAKEAAAPSSSSSSSSSSSTRAANVLNTGTATSGAALIPASLSNGVKTDKMMQMLVPTPLQPIIDPNLSTDPAGVNATREGTRKRAALTKGIPFLIAAGAGVGTGLLVEGALTTTTAGLAAVPGIAVGGMVGGVVFNTTYRVTEKVARKLVNKFGGTQTGPLLAETADYGYNRTADAQQLDAEIAAEKNKTIVQHAKEMVPVMAGGAAGALIGAGVMNKFGPAFKNVFTSNVATKGAATTAGMA